ncbi:MAG: phage tail tape measure protein [Paraclostridium sp.]
MEDFKLKGKVVLDDSGFKSGLNDLKSQGESFGSSFKNSMFGAMTAANLASKGVELLVSTLRSAVSEFTLLDKNIAKVNTLLDQQVLSSTNLRMELLRVSSATGIYASELANASYEALSAGVETQNLTGFIEQMTALSQGGFTSVTSAVDVTTSIMNAYGKEVYSVNEISDKLIKTQAQGKTSVDQLSKSLFNVVPIASTLNVGIDEVLGSIALLTKSGTPTSVATTQIRSAMAELTTETSDVAKTFKDITGKTFPEFIKSGGTLSQAIQYLGEYAKQTNVPVTTLFGSVEAGGAVAVLAAEDTKRLKEEIKGVGNSTGETEKASKIATDNIGTQWGKLATKLKNAFVEDNHGVLSIINKTLLEMGKASVDLLTYDAKKSFKSFEKEYAETVEKLNKIQIELGIEVKNYDITKDNLASLRKEAEELSLVRDVKVSYEKSKNFEADEAARIAQEEADKKEAERLAKIAADKKKAEEKAIQDAKDAAEAKRVALEKARIAENAIREKELEDLQTFEMKRAKLQSDFDIQQFDKDIEFFNQISDLRNQNLLSEADIDLMYDDYQYQRFLEEQAFKEEQLQSDLTFYANKKQYAEEYLQTLADLKQVEVDTLSAKIDKEKEIKDREISLQNTWEKNKESIYRKSYQTLVNSNKNVLKAMGDFALQSIAMIMQEAGQELFVRGMKDMLIGKAKATLTVTAPAIAAEGVLQDLRGAQAVAAGLALGAAGSAVSSLGSSSSSSDSSGSSSTGYTEDINDREVAYSTEQEKSVTIYTDGDMKDVMLSMLGTLNDLSKDYNNIEIVSK